METETIERSKHTGRPQGKGNLSDEIKIGIIGAKKLQLMSQSKIAEEFNVARFTVNRLSENDLSPAGKSKLDDYTAKLVKARDKIIDNINKKLDADDFKDGVYPALYTAINTGHRLETNQSTANINIADCAQIAKQAFEIQAKLASADQDQSPLTQAEKIAIYEEICLAQGQQPDVSLLELDAEETE